LVNLEVAGEKRGLGVDWHSCEDSLTESGVECGASLECVGGDVFVVTVCDSNVAGSGQPDRAEGLEVGGVGVEGDDAGIGGGVIGKIKADGVIGADVGPLEWGFDEVIDGGEDLVGGSDCAEQDFGPGFGGEDIGGGAAVEDADVEGGGAESVIAGPVVCAKGVQTVEQVMDGGVAAFGEGRVSGDAGGMEFQFNHAFLAGHEAILGGFTQENASGVEVEVARTPRATVIDFLADDE